MDCNTVVFSGHALRRMFQRSVARSDVMEVVSVGEVIAEYSDDDPFPSFLVLATVGGRPLHVVIGVDESSQACYIITVYGPDPDRWEEDFRIRRIK